MNILFLMTDQHRVDTLGCYGNQRIRTPNIDRLAAAGTTFDRCYTPTAICTPARASLLTGHAPFRHKLLANYERNVGYMEDLPHDQFTFAGPLRDHGYALGLFGKWHVGTHRTAADFGFDGPHMPGWHNPVDHPDYLAYLAEHGLPEHVVNEPVYARTPSGIEHLMAGRLEQPVEATFEHYLATRTIQQLETYARRSVSTGAPFFLATHFFGPHLPYLLPDEYFDLHDPDEMDLPPSLVETFAGKPEVQRNYSAHWGFDTMRPETLRQLIAAYWGYVTLIDHQVGRILTALSELGLTDTTSVFFTADHGEFTGSHRLHDKGPAMYEDVYRIPGIVRVPGMPAGQVCDEFASLTDMTATILDLAGADPAPAVDSRSLLPLVRGDDVDWPRELVAEFHGHHFPYPQRMIRDERYKLVVNPESRNELYDLQADPHELQNRYEHPELAPVRSRLTRRLHHLLRERGDNFHHWMTTMYDVDTTTDANALFASTRPQRPAT